MNVIISNKYTDKIKNLEIDVSKKMEGEFEIEEILSTFSGYFFNKMIIDITSIKRYEDINVLKQIPMTLDADKIIFLLDGENINQKFLSQLVDIGIYNFTTTIEGLMYLYNNPNSYSDVAKYQNPSFESKISQNKEEKVIEPIIPSTKYSFDNRDISQRTYVPQGRYILGIKSITNGAGATTLTYILKNEISNYRNVAAIEINKKDFIFLRDPDLISIDDIELNATLDKLTEKDVIILDLNSYGNITICDEILYLIEPSTIKLNKMVMLDRKIFDKLNGKKIVLNKSLLNRKDISSFELESGSKVYYNIPPLDEKVSNHDELIPLIKKLNIIDSSNTSEDNDKFLGIFKI